MNIFQEIITKHHVNNMYVPWGWLILKNNLINRDFSLAEEYNGGEQFEIIDNFFSTGVFYAKNEITLDGNNLISVITVDFIRDSSSIENGGSHYTIELHIFKNKKKDPVYEYESKNEGIDNMTKELNFLLNFVSNFIFSAKSFSPNNIDEEMMEVRKNI